MISWKHWGCSWVMLNVIGWCKNVYSRKLRIMISTWSPWCNICMAWRRLLRTHLPLLDGVPRVSQAGVTLHTKQRTHRVHVLPERSWRSESNDDRKGIWHAHCTKILMALEIFNRNVLRIMMPDLNKRQEQNGWFVEVLCCISKMSIASNMEPANKHVSPYDRFSIFHVQM